jgi:hypothetical protein
MYSCETETIYVCRAKLQFSADDLDYVETWQLANGEEDRSLFRTLTEPLTGKSLFAAFCSRPCLVRFRVPLPGYIHQSLALLTDLHGMSDLESCGVYDIDRVAVFAENIHPRVIRTRPEIV